MFNPPQLNRGPDGTTCRDVIETLMAYIDNELSSSDRDELERHLRICRSCVNYLDSYRASVRAASEAMRAQTADEPLPDALVKAVLDARRSFGHGSSSDGVEPPQQPGPQ